MSLVALIENENYKHLKTEWHPKNKFKPEHYSATSNIKVWWLCTITCSNSEYCCHEWFARINSRTTFKSNCPFCNNGSSKPCCYKTSLASPKYLHLQQQWSTKNKIRPIDCKIGSQKKIIWECKKTCQESSSCKHEWTTTISHRKQTGCPFCAGRRICCNARSLAIPEYRHLVSEWARRAR